MESLKCSICVWCHLTRWYKDTDLTMPSCPFRNIQKGWKQAFHINRGCLKAWARFFFSLGGRWGLGACLLSLLHYFLPPSQNSHVNQILVLSMRTVPILPSWSFWSTVTSREASMKWQSCLGDIKYRVPWQSTRRATSLQPGLVSVSCPVLEDRISKLKTKQ